MSYDPEDRRTTPLAEALARRIERDGPIPVSAYMEACLDDEAHGYYRTRQAIGRDGDFITAPEISQTFGELVGLWAAVVWQQMGSPSALSLVEVGPGRGTLMADALRATRRVPGFHAALSVAMVERSQVLTELQRRALAAAPVEVTWHFDLDSVPRGRPAIIIANELLDCFPVTQIERVADGWRERGVGLRRDGTLGFCTLPETAAPPYAAGDTPPGTVMERRDWTGIAGSLAAFSAAAPLAALFIDYGHVESAPGDTLQAVRAQRYEHPLTSPGEADLTAQVDFADFARVVRANGLAVDGPVSQAELLGALGIVERASRLMSANPGQAAAIETAVARLIAPGGMGTRFQAIGVRTADLAPLPALARMDKPSVRP